MTHLLYAAYTVCQRPPTFYCYFTLVLLMLWEINVTSLHLTYLHCRANPHPNYHVNVWVEKHFSVLAKNHHDFYIWFHRDFGELLVATELLVGEPCQRSKIFSTFWRTHLHLYSTNFSYGCYAVLMWEVFHHITLSPEANKKLSKMYWHAKSELCGIESKGLGLQVSGVPGTITRLNR